MLKQKHHILTFDLPVLLVCCDNCEGFSFPLAINMALTLAAASAAASRLLLLPGPVAFCMTPGPPTQFLEQNQIKFEKKLSTLQNETAQ